MRWLLVLSVAACGPTPATAPATAPAAPTSTTSAPTADADVAEPPPAEPPPPRAAPRPARDTHPEGVRPLDATEQAEVVKSCKKLVDAIAAVVKKKNPTGRMAATSAMLEELAKPPPVAGVDVP